LGLIGSVNTKWYLLGEDLRCYIVPNKNGYLCSVGEDDTLLAQSSWVRMVT